MIQWFVHWTAHQAVFGLFLGKSRHFALTVLTPPRCTIIIVTSRVCTGPGKPGKSWNFIVAFSRAGKSWKKATGPRKFWKSVKLK